MEITVLFRLIVYIIMSDSFLCWTMWRHWYVFQHSAADWLLWSTETCVLWMKAWKLARCLALCSKYNRKWMHAAHQINKKLFSVPLTTLSKKVPATLFPLAVRPALWLGSYLSIFRCLSYWQPFTISLAIRSYRLARVTNRVLICSLFKYLVFEIAYQMLRK